MKIDALLENFVTQSCSDLKELRENVSEIKGKLIEHQISLKSLDNRLNSLCEEIETPKKFRNVIVTRVITTIIVSSVIGFGAYVGELLYNAPSPKQQQLLEKIEFQKHLKSRK